MKKLLVIFFLTVAAKASATHFRAGQITYAPMDSQCKKFKITATLYTKDSAPASDMQCDIVIYTGTTGILFGGSIPDSLVVNRSNGPTGTECPGAFMGQGIPGSDVRVNIYETEFTYPGPGSYTIYTNLRNRNQGITNIPSSQGYPMYLYTILTINPFTFCNTSAILINPPIDVACKFQCWTHNPNAYDPDGDSLAFKISQSLDAYGALIPGYSYPPVLGGGSMSVNPYTGDLTWCPGPTTAGQYNVAMKIEEWRKIGSNYYKVGEIFRDIQIDVLDNCLNNPPSIANVEDTCVVAGSSLTFNITATDPDGDSLLLSATGSPFSFAPAATFTTPTYMQASPATGTFSWTPDCNRVRNQPYIVTFNAVDTLLSSSLSVPLVDYETVLITVVAPAPTITQVVPQCNTMKICWTTETCNPATNPCIGYKIYRRVGCSSWTPSPCETGVPAYTGYVLAGETYNKDSTCFTDDNGGAGLTHGVDYSYRVCAKFLDGAQSLSSAEVCARLKRDVPIITNVDVTGTNTTSGTIDVKWVAPIADPLTALDTIAFPGPYEYRLLRGTGFTGASTQVQLFNAAFFAGGTGITSFNSFADAGLNTQDNAYNYRLEFYYTSGSTLTLLCQTQSASSVYLDCTPSDNMLTLTWQATVPWANTTYEVWKRVPPPSGPFVLVATVSSPTYIDTGLVNGATYCYVIKAIGAYSDTSLPAPLINWSEEHCCVPIDLIPSCPPSLDLAFDCELGNVTLNWTNPNTYCADDVISYNIYFAAVYGDPYILIGTTNTSTTTTLSLIGLSSIAGCYVVTAVDSFGNESNYSNQFCIDNCPLYELPNVFSPNGDGFNDFFVPFPYRYIKDIDLKIFNRWGDVVFETTDPKINWDGKHMKSKAQCSDGVYFYTCVVNEIHLSGIVPRGLKGFVHLFNNPSSSPSK